jgi:hypothetical protein
VEPFEGAITDCMEDLREALPLVAAGVGVAFEMAAGDMVVCCRSRGGQGLRQVQRCECSNWYDVCRKGPLGFSTPSSSGWSAGPATSRHSKNARPTTSRISSLVVGLVVGFSISPESALRQLLRYIRGI